MPHILPLLVSQMDGPINPAEICPLIPPQSGERWRSPDTDLTRIFLDVLLELIVSQVTLIEWKEDRLERQRRCLAFLVDKFKTFYMMHIFPDFNWAMSLYRPSLELPERRKFRPAFVDAGDGTKRVDPMLSCRVVVIKWVAQFTHLTRGVSNNNTLASSTGLAALQNMSVSVSTGLNGQASGEADDEHATPSPPAVENAAVDLATSLEGALVREVLYGSRENVDFVHEVYRQAFLLSFSHSPAIKKVITVYKDWIQMNVPELPPFLLEPARVDKEREEFRNVMAGKMGNSDSPLDAAGKEHMEIRAGLQNVLQVFVTNAANVFLLEVSSEYPILLEEQVEMCKRVLNIYRYMVMNVKMEARTWEQLLFILLQITQLTLPESPPRKRADTLGGRLAQAVFQTLIVTWIKANLYVVVSVELWDQFLEVLSGLTLWEELVKEWAKTMETLTRVLARQVYNLDLNDLPLDRLSERAAKKRRGKQGGQESKTSNTNVMNSSRQSASSAMTNSASALPPPTSPRPPSADPGTCADQHVDRASGAHRRRVYSESRQQSEPAAHVRSNHNASESGRNASRRISRRHQRPMRRSKSESDIEAKLVAWRKEVLRVERELRLRDFTVDDGGGRRSSRQRHRSADSIPHHGLTSTSDRGAGSSRSSSPAPSSGLMDCHSMKDANLQLDHDAISESGLSSDGLHSSAHHGSASGYGYYAADGQHAYAQQTHHHHHLVSQNSAPRSVMAGGGVKGWLPDVAVVLWRRMLGAMGDVNAVGDAAIHAMVYKYLIELFDILVKIRANQGVSFDNASTPPPPDYVPPFTVFAPWCLRALALPSAYQRGRVYALRLLAALTCRPHDAPLPRTHLVQFYKVLHDGLSRTGGDRGEDPGGKPTDEMNTVVKFTGARFFSLMLPGYSAYVLDFLYAANCLISSPDLKGVPRTEATSVVGALLSFPAVVAALGKPVPLLVPSTGRFGLATAADIKDQIVGVLLKSGKKEPAGLARCVALSSLGVFAYTELATVSAGQPLHPKLKEAAQVLLTALKFNNKAVAQIASDMILLLADHVPRWQMFFPEVPKKVVEVLSRALTSLAPKTEAGEDEKRLLLSLMMCLGEWCSRLPPEVLTLPMEDGKSLLHQVFASLQVSSSFYVHDEVVYQSICWTV